MSKRFHCHYCDVRLSHSSESVRRQHAAGNRHKARLCDYYKRTLTADMQARIDAVVADFADRVALGHTVPSYGVSAGTGVSGWGGGGGWGEAVRVGGWRGLSPLPWASSLRG
ncbi:hypothetical protein MMPV_009702 [Pyropia vietnamensis]